jgi:hypothetical protein
VEKFRQYLDARLRSYSQKISRHERRVKVELASRLNGAAK